MRGIILAGGSGTRLYPVTHTVSKQLLPVYDKPMIYYPLSVLMLAGIREILVISSPLEVPLFGALLGDGSQWGLRIGYAVQERPNGIAEALLIGADFIGDDSVALMLGDNLLYGPGIAELLRSAAGSLDGCVLFGHHVANPVDYGVCGFDSDGVLTSITEKPTRPESNWAVTGLYFYDNDVVALAGDIRPSARGELEITDVNREYLARGRVRLIKFGRGFTWLDTGTPDSLLAAAQFVQVLQQRQGVRIACVEEVALRMGYIDADRCYQAGLRLSRSEYGRYLMSVAHEWADAEAVAEPRDYRLTSYSAT